MGMVGEEYRNEEVEETEDGEGSLVDVPWKDELVFFYKGRL